ncbi:MAG: hypothetical protein R3B06_18075 [Kofleriaceae bacterium]
MNRAVTATRVVVVTAALALACGGATKPAPAPPPAADLLSTDEMVELCVRLHTEVTTCAPEFVGLNLDLRAQYSPEFAQMIADPAVRAQVVAEGVAETAADAADAQARCTEFAQPAWGPAQPRADLATLEGCYAEPACDAKMACLRPVIEPRFAYRAAHDGPH